MPKTGGTWCRKAIEEAGHAAVFVPPYHQLPTTAPSCYHVGTIVRNPINWYRSAYAYSVKLGDTIGGKHWRDWLKMFIGADPSLPWPEWGFKVPSGTLSKLYDRFAPPDGRYKILRHETIADDLEKWLLELGIPFNRKKLREARSTLINHTKEVPIVVGPDLERWIRKSEAQAFERFGW